MGDVGEVEEVKTNIGGIWGVYRGYIGGIWGVSGNDFILDFGFKTLSYSAKLKFTSH